MVYEIEENALRVVADLQGGDWMVAARGGNGGTSHARSYPIEDNYFQSKAGKKN